MTQQQTGTQKAVADLIESYRQGLLQLDPTRLGSIWDREHVPLIYVAMERPEPIQGWPAIENYFEADRAARVTMLFKRTQTEWLAFHYHESALAAQVADQISRMKAIRVPK